MQSRPSCATSQFPHLKVGITPDLLGTFGLRRDEGDYSEFFAVAGRGPALSCCIYLTSFREGVWRGPWQLGSPPGSASSARWPLRTSRSCVPGLQLGGVLGREQPSAGHRSPAAGFFAPAAGVSAVTTMAFYGRVGCPACRLFYGPCILGATPQGQALRCPRASVGHSGVQWAPCVACERWGWGGVGWEARARGFQ